MRIGLDFGSSWEEMQSTSFGNMCFIPPSQPTAQPAIASSTGEIAEGRPVDCSEGCESCAYTAEGSEN